VLAPADGRIVEVTDSDADTPPGTNGDHANHLVMDIGGGRYVALAHLEQGSVTVRVGDIVRQGQPLAAVGNNGHSNEPHPHLQVQDSPAAADAERTYPMVFRNVDITRGGAWPGGDPRGSSHRRPAPSVREVRSNLVGRSCQPRAASLLSVAALAVLVLAGCGGSSADPPAHADDLYQVDGETAHLQCQVAGSPTLVFLGGRGFTTTTWARFRAALGPDVRTCAWDHPGVGHSTGAPMMTAARAASSLDGTLSAAKVPRPVILSGIASPASRPASMSDSTPPMSLASFDPTVASFARMFDDREFRPGWDGTASADQDEQVTTWPDIPFEILRHDPAVYATGKVWSEKVEALWAADQAAFATLAPHGSATVVQGSGHNVFQDAQAVSVAAVRRVPVPP
jgi:Peptidase family M23